MYKGVPQNDMGRKTDIMDNLPKAIGMKMLIRSMSPEIICADEIGNEEDIEAIEQAVCSGIKGIFTAHGDNFENLNLNPCLKKLINSHIFEKIIFLKKHGIKGDIKSIYALDKKNSDYISIPVLKQGQAEYI